MSNLDFSIGELIIMGFEGTTLSSDTLQTIQSEQVTQFILFKENYANKEQLIALTDDLQSYSTSSPFLITVDQEGGRVQRFRNDFTLLPPARKIGDKGSVQLGYEIAQLQAKELFAAGIQLNFAPVCDINTNPANQVIGDRAFGSDAETVSKFAVSLLRAHHGQHVETCIKHFPGHGDTHLDSHFALPTVNTPLDVLRSREWVPFRQAIQAGARFVMSAHLLLPHLDENRPGTLSDTILKNYLRGELGYQGVIISDDMEMHAITKHFGEDDAPVMALQAGCDLLCYRHEAQAKSAIRSIKKALFEKKLSAEALHQSALRVRAVREKIILARDHLTPAQRLELIGHPNHLKLIAENF